jgi:16S rRNA (uracil1498-N3)-methyltransferase
MSVPIFFAPPENRQGDLIVLGASEAHHANSVMRLREGNLVIVVDGCGMAVRGEIVSISEKRVEVKAHADIRNFGEPSVRLTLAAGLSVGEKFDTVVEKGTELGAKRFVPIISEKSKVKLDEPSKATARRTRLEKVALAAMKQCRRSYLPEIATPLTLRQFLEETDRNDLNLAFLPSESSRSLDKVPFGSGIARVSLLIGPESGFSEAEIDHIIAAGFSPVSLGSRILRTETAGPVVTALIMDRLGELK